VAALGVWVGTVLAWRASSAVPRNGREARPFPRLE
jgi:hypothetical protein